MPMFKKSMLVLLAVVALAAGGAFYAGMHGQEEAVTLDAGTTPQAKAPAKESEIVVYVAGAVNRPGVVQLAEGARAKDAVDACGGFLPTADTNGVNLAQKLKDGMQVTVPEKSPQGTAAQGAAGGAGQAAGHRPRHGKAHRRVPHGKRRVPIARGDQARQGHR